MERPPFTVGEKKTIIDPGDWLSTETMGLIVEGKIKAVQDPDRCMKENDEMISQYQAFKESEEYSALSLIKIFEKTKDQLQQRGYYEVAIPLIRKMSPDYNEYYLKLLSANEKFISDGKIIENN